MSPCSRGAQSEKQTTKLSRLAKFQRRPRIIARMRTGYTERSTLIGWSIKVWRGRREVIECLEMQVHARGGERRERERFIELSVGTIGCKGD